MKVERFNFPGGEVHVRTSELEEGETAHITHFIRTSDDVMALFLVTDAVRRSGKTKIHLTLPYIPYARQDRVAVEGEPLSIKVFADMINAQNYESVTIWDPHSDVTPALINRCKIVYQHEIVIKNKEVMGITPDTVLVCPDAGARKKTLRLAVELGLGNQIIFADKVRDVVTGKITGTTLGGLPEGNYPLDRDFMIVDDIGDGCFTFTELAKLLIPLTTGKVKLYVTHGVFSKGVGVFNGLVHEVYTPNSWIPVHGPQVVRTLCV
jgi:ribose-phosphate pyrophosphokinase